MFFEKLDKQVFLNYNNRIQKLSYVTAGELPGSGAPPLCARVSLLFGFCGTGPPL